MTAGLKLFGTIAVRERRLAGLIRQKRIDKLRLELTALPTDYMVWAVANHADARFLNLRGLIARWVTPLAPAAQNFVHALRKEPSDAHFDAGLKRVYEGLRALRFTYDTKRVNFGTTMEHDFQRVRLPSKSLAHRQINCIDGTVLLASVVEALGYRPAVVFIPGHAFLALLFGEDMNSISRILCIESTGLCRGTGGSGISYEEATRVGLAQFEEHREKLFGKERDVTRFEIVPIERSRAEGIQGFGE